MTNRNTRRGLTQINGVGQVLPDNAPGTGHCSSCVNRGNYSHYQAEPDLHKQHNGFTLIELLFVGLIIGILAAVALPQYKKAVTKSRISALMPIAQSIANAQETYFLEEGNYTRNESDLAVDIPADVNIGFSNKVDLKYVAARWDDFPDIAYLVYQKLSPKFPATTMCEASTEEAEAVCKALGGEKISANGTVKGWAAYLLSGEVGDDTFGCHAGSYYADIGSGESECTKAPAGSYVKNGELTACAAGTYSAVEGSTACTRCATMSYASGTGNTSCTHCPVGHYNNMEGNTNCIPCYGQIRSSQATSYPSPTGDFMPKYECKSCATGKYAMLGDCVSTCPAGTRISGSRCMECPAGQSSSAGSTTCTQCPAGTYAPRTGSTCRACPAGTTSNAARTGCK